jgi:hypothetical protein
MTLEKGGAFLRHCEHIFAYSEVKGIAHNLHDGPEYFFICAQHDEQIGEWENTSDAFSQDGHSEG